MKIRSLTVLASLAVVAGSAAATEAVHIATNHATPAAQAVEVSAQHHLQMQDMGRFTQMYAPSRPLSAVNMPACSTCH